MKRPKVGVAVIVVKGNKVLVGKRRNNHGNGTYHFPGGHLEFGESPEGCARREVKEETGVNIKNIKFIAITNDIFEKEKKHYITIFILAEYNSGKVELKEPEKCEGWEWFEWNKLPRPLFLPVENLLKQDYNPFNK